MALAEIANLNTLNPMVIIRVPATTANLGPGYDCLGVALQIHNRVTVAREAGGELHAPEPSSMVAHAAQAYFEAAGVAAFPFGWRIRGDVPQSRGMGSSVTVRLGLLTGLNQLAETPLDRNQIFQLCARLEGHPDNAAPAAFGGFTVANGTTLARFEVAPELAFVLLIPAFEVSTPEARKVLPAQLDRLAAVASCANACRITAAFASGKYELLRGAFVDGLHQPFRQQLIPFLSEVIAAGEAAGALGGFLSGSGSTICCVTLQDPEAVAAAMLEASGSPGARTMITHAENAGTSVVAAE
jgi:homoserine kinase